MTLLEKALKGLVHKVTERTPPFTHDLLVLSKLAQLSLTKTQEAELSTINTFNIRARYADYKFAFYKKADKQYTKRYCAIAEELFQWFLNRS